MARTPELMGIGRASQFLGIDEGTLRRWNRSGDGPPRTRKGKRYYYVREILKEWLKSNAPSPDLQLRRTAQSGQNRPVPLRAIGR